MSFSSATVTDLPTDGAASATVLSNPPSMAARAPRLELPSLAPEELARILSGYTGNARQSKRNACRYSLGKSWLNDVLLHAVMDRRPSFRPYDLTQIGAALQNRSLWEPLLRGSDLGHHLGEFTYNKFLSAYCVLLRAFYDYTIRSHTQLQSWLSNNLSHIVDTVIATYEGSFNNCETGKRRKRKTSSSVSPPTASKRVRVAQNPAADVSDQTSNLTLAHTSGLAEDHIRDILDNSSKNSTLSMTIATTVGSSSGASASSPGISPSPASSTGPPSDKFFQATKP